MKLQENKSPPLLPTVSISTLEKGMAVTFIPFEVPLQTVYVNSEANIAGPFTS